MSGGWGTSWPALTRSATLFGRHFTSHQMKRVSRNALLGRVALAVLVATLLTGCSIPASNVTMLSPGTPGVKMHSTFDRISGYSRVQTLVFYRPASGGLLSRPISVELQLYTTHEGDTLTAPPHDVTFWFSTSSPTRLGWAFLHSHDLSFLIDDSTRIRLDGDRHSHADHILVREDIFVTVPLLQFLQIARANKVEGRLGIWEFTLSPEEIATIREIAEYLVMAPESAQPAKGIK
jgi:hypothetical protein